MEQTSSINLTNCEQEPIHIPRHIQPHGFLLALSPGSLLIEKVSANTEMFTGKGTAALLGQPLSSLQPVITPAKNESSLTDLVTLGSLTGNFEQLNPQEVIVGGKRMFLICHQHKDHIICEFEPFRSDDSTITLQKIMGTALPVIQSSSSFDELLNHVAGMVKKITGYSRIMIYRFHKDQHGEVVAEAREEGLESWLHLHYPASDIPVQARKLYKLNLVRIIADVYSQPSALLSYESNTSPLDLTHSVLRAVSPVHIEYLKNMEVGASFSISLLSKNELWGLIACHNAAPKFIDYNSRVACKFIGQLFSAALEFKSDERIEERNNLLMQKQQQLFEQLLRENDPATALTKREVTLLDINSATGAVFYYEGKMYRLGVVPSEEEIAGIITWIRGNEPGDFYQTSSLPLRYAPAEKIATLASGIMVTEIGHDLGEYLMWFKPEIAKTVDWAGSEQKDMQVQEDGIARISPRKSFAKWTQEVRHTSEEWTNYEISAAMRLREDLIQIINKKASEIRKLNDLLKAAYDELDTFSFTISHDLRSPLSAIRNYSEIIMEDYGHEFSEEAKDLFQRVIRGTDKMAGLIKDVLHYSRVGRAGIEIAEVNMQKMLTEIREELLGPVPGRHIQFHIKNTPPVTGDKTMLMQLFTNLAGNAVKYSTDSDPALIEIDGEIKDDFVVYTISDNGIGIDMKYGNRIFELFRRLDNVKNIEGTGVGLAIAKRIVEKHAGKIWLESRLAHGTKFYIALPVKQQENAQEHFIRGRQ